jgi:putative protease
MKKPELLSPAGSFPAAYHALEAGADALYLGLKEFSARKAAQNFSREQLRRVRKLAADRGRRVYVAVNTVVSDADMPRLAENLCWLEALAVDAVIVQDIGVCELLARHFPRITVHASTQMAIHNTAGLRMAKDLGIRRVILSRELPLERIRELREAHPDIELEVFIHGALCYSFSGVCLASWALTGRSGNRGDCAQICRSLFKDRADGESGRDDAPCADGRAEVYGERAGGHFFSCRDLFIGREVQKLAEIGVDGLKIEGRMKSPEYVFNVTRLYRQILDRGEKLPEGEYRELLRRAELGFSRKKTTGWLHEPAGESLIEQRYPGHRGASLGTVEAVQGKEILLRLEAELSIRDGVGFFLPGVDEPVIFSVARIRKAGRETKFARAGDRVGVEVPAETSGGMPEPGAEIRHFSSRFLDLPQPKEAGLAPWKVPLDMKVRMGEGGVLAVEAGGYPAFASRVTLEAASQKKPFIGIMEKLLAESGDSLFTPARVSLENTTGLPDDGLFVPPSQLKKLKNELYAFLDTSFLALTAGRAAEAQIAPPPIGTEPEISAPDLAALSHRAILNPPRFAPVPYAAGLAAGIKPADLALHAGFRWLPLPPVIMEEQASREALRNVLAENPGEKFAIGLNNISHLAIAEELAAAGNAWFYADFSLYVANSWALVLLRRRIPGLLFAYGWIEGETAPSAALVITADFRPPLFYSLGCYQRHAVNDGKCFDDCPQYFAQPLWQGKNRFQLIVRDCVTYLFADP